MDHSAAITTYTQNFLAQTGFPPEVTVKTKYDTDGNLYQILLESPNPSLVIGYHGENLSSLQLVLSQHLHSQLDEWVNLSLNVNDYRERRQSSLEALADSAVSKVLATGQAHSLPPMPAAERRIVHLYLSEHPQISTYSEGTGKTRSVIVALKDPSSPTS